MTKSDKRWIYITFNIYNFLFLFIPSFILMRFFLIFRMLYKLHFILWLILTLVNHLLFLYHNAIQAHGEDNVEVSI